MAAWKPHRECGGTLDFRNQLCARPELARPLSYGEMPPEILSDITVGFVLFRSQ